MPSKATVVLKTELFMPSKATVILKTELKATVVLKTELKATVVLKTELFMLSNEAVVLKKMAIYAFQ